MTRGDRRQRVVESALASPILTPREKLLMVVVTQLKPEYIDGKRRHASKAMGPDGKFTLHYDYIGRALGTSEGNVEKILAACKRKGHLDHVHAGTFGRTATWQALVVRADEIYGLTFRQFVAPYESEETAVRADETSALVYRTPDLGDHAPESGGPPGARVTEKRHDEARSSKAVFRPTVCEWHREMPCDPDCANAEATRRQAS